MKKGIISLLMLILLVALARAIYLGTCEGYVRDSLGNLVQGALVNVTVINCSAEPCSQTTYSDSGGYYVVANLNLEPYGWVRVTATKNTAYGEATGQADQFQAAYVNVTMCTAPSPPTLQPIADTHDPSFFIFNWTSFGQIDDFYFDGATYHDVSPPQYRYNLDWGTHTWGVRSCNASCCSPWQYDSFDVYNNPPPAPTLVDQPDTTNNTVELKWFSVTDPEGDAVYYDFYLDSQPIEHNVSSPQIKHGLSFGAHEWGVRACDQFGACSAWSTDTFNIVCEPPSSPTLQPIADTHDPSFFIFNWTSGIDPNAKPTYDDFYFDGTVYHNIIPPQNRTNLAFKTYTWGARTCNQDCCSPWQYDSFDVYNNPPPAPSLVDVPDTNENEITFEWSNVTDPENDPVYYDFKLDGVVETQVSSPIIKTDLAFGHHSWAVRACDPWVCSDWSTDSFTIYNRAPSKPTLTDQPHTDASSVALQWQSGTDPDGDPTYDEYQFDSAPIKSPATSPQIETLTGIALHSWKVRTCDNKGACSVWASDDFIRYECPPKPPRPPRPPTGAGLICPPSIIVALECEENWICEAWGPCDPYTQTQTRECIDLNRCNTTCFKPQTWRHCTYTPTCYDGIKNQGEEGIDCGGPCPPCPRLIIPAVPPRIPGIVATLAITIAILAIAFAATSKLREEILLILRLRKLGSLIAKGLRKKAQNYFENKVKRLHQKIALRYNPKKLLHRVIAAKHKKLKERLASLK